MTTKNQRAAVSAGKQGLKAGRSYIETTDKIARELDIPLVATALAVQDKVFEYADALGIGTQVRGVVYAVRTVGYASAVLGPAATVAATGAVASMGAMGALGAVGVAAAVLGALFGGGPDEEELRKKRRAADKQLTGRLMQMIKRLSFEDLAKEQDAIAGQYDVVAKSIDDIRKAVGKPIPQKLWDVQAGAQKKSALARKVAIFYRTLPPKLSELEEEFYLSNTNLGRWTTSRKQIGQMKSRDQEHAAQLVADMSNISKADRLSMITKGKGGSKKYSGFPSLTAMLTKQIDEETKRLQKAAAALPADYRPPSAPTAVGPRIALKLPPGARLGGLASAAPKRTSGTMQVAVPAAAAAAGFLAFGPIGAAVALAAGIGVTR